MSEAASIVSHVFNASYFTLCTDTNGRMGKQIILILNNSAQVSGSGKLDFYEFRYLWDMLSSWRVSSYVINSSMR